MQPQAKGHQDCSDYDSQETPKAPLLRASRRNPPHGPWTLDSALQDRDPPPPGGGVQPEPGQPRALGRAAALRWVSTPPKTSAPTASCRDFSTSIPGFP